MTVEGVELGRFLFYDKKLSANNSMSCGSCHMQSTAFSDAPGVAKSTGIRGMQTRRNAMPIFNLAFQEFFFWDGRVSSLEEQSLHPIRDTIEFANSVDTVMERLRRDPMYPPLFKAAFGDETINEDRFSKAIAQFQRSIISANSEYDQVKRKGGPNNPFDDPSAERGYRLFHSLDGADCLHCHGETETKFLLGAFGQDGTFVNNGLKASWDDEGRKEVTGRSEDLGKFKVPSVRNIEFSFPYMHDGSIPNLDSLIEFYNFGGHPISTGNNVDPNMEFAGKGGLRLTPQEKDDLKAFLKTLTDYDFLTEEAYSDPFQ